jgi:beta-lactam-binding protein with PASTA domain
MLLALLVVALAGGAVAAYVLVRNHDDAKTQTVVVTQSTTPPAGGGSAIRLPVPSVIGQSARAATASLRRAGFRTTLVQVASTFPKGTVVSQAPKAASRAAHDSVVRLNVSSGAQPTQTATTPAATNTSSTQTAPATTSTPSPSAPPRPAEVAVPSLSGSLQPATQQLTRAGLRVSVAYVPSTQPIGTVVAQSPESGAKAKTGSQVTVNVSWGPRRNESETVPNVVGSRIRAAVSTLQHTGLRLIFVRAPVTDHTRAGTVVAQSPLPGRHAPKNGQVLVYMGAVETG